MLFPSIQLQLHHHSASPSSLSITSTTAAMTRSFRKRLTAVTLLLLLICGSVLFLLHDHLSSKGSNPYIDMEELAQLYNHATRKPAPKTTTLAPRPQIHVKNIPPPSVHINMTMRQVEYYFFLFLEDKSIRCENDIRLGNMHDGGWNVCLSPPFALKAPCIVFSFGVGYDWQFDDSVSKMYGCRVLAFDPRYLDGLAPEYLQGH